MARVDVGGLAAALELTTSLVAPRRRDADLTLAGMHANTAGFVRRELDLKSPHVRIEPAISRQNFHFPSPHIVVGGIEGHLSFFDQ